MVYAQLTPWNVSDLSHADLVIMQKLTPGEIRLSSANLRGSGIDERLAAVSPDEISLLAGGQLQVATLALTSVERYMIGEVSRTRRQPELRQG